MTHAIVNERLLGRRLQWRPGKILFATHRRDGVDAQQRVTWQSGIPLFINVLRVPWPGAAPASVKRIQH